MVPSPGRVDACDEFLCAAALLQQAAPLSVSEINVPKFCAECGGRTMAARTPPGDERPRAAAVRAATSPTRTRRWS